MKFYRFIPVIEKDLRGKSGEPVNGRFVWPVPAIFVHEGLKEGAVKERVKLHEWWHVMQYLAPAIPFIAAYIALFAGVAVPAVSLIACGVLALAPPLLSRIWPRYRIEMEAMAKGAEVADGNSLKQEARSLALSKTYAHSFTLEYCTRRIAFWSRVLGRKAG